MLRMRRLLRYLVVPVTIMAALTVVSQGNAQGKPELYHLTLAGPPTIRVGEEIAYVLTDELAETPPVTTMFFTTPAQTTFVSAGDFVGISLDGATVGMDDILSSSPGFASRVVGQSNVELIFNPSANNGQVTIRVRVDENASGQIEALANFQVTGLAPSNRVLTIIQPGSLPLTGTNGESGAVWSVPVLVTGSLLLSVGLLAVFAASTRRRRHR